MKTVKLFLLLTGMSLASGTQASLDRSWDLLRQSNGSTKYYPQIVKDMVDNGLYFSSVPYIKEYLISTKGVENREIDELIDRVITEVGVKQFEVLPSSVLERSKAPTVKYILAKKYFRVGKYSETLNSLNATIPRGHPTKPFALQLEASVHSIQGNQVAATNAYKECTDLSRAAIKRTQNMNRKRQLEINRDYCIVGIPRAQFADKKYEEANSTYLDLDKDSYIWPEILFEEAWNSFYLRDYNRTLGKLVTYNAPLLDYIFNPEVDVLRALTYMELCLWDDARKTVDTFYATYENAHDGVKKLLDQHGKDYKYYYLLAKSSRAGRIRGNSLVDKLLTFIVRDATYIELFDSFNRGRDEIERIKKVGNQRHQKILINNLKESMLLQRNLIGAYVRKQLSLHDQQLVSSFEGMSYIKLEVLNRKKQYLYSPDSFVSRSRGDVKNIVRNDKQYFWTFNGEFWADELGDYVFSLKSECE